ncbi:MAG: fused MFS/spermidine synthase [Pseudohongiellaceae bacterium]
MVSSTTGAPVADGQKQGRLIRYTILSVAFLNGFAIMSVELLGGRVLAPWFGTSVYVWGSIITVFMLSLSLGYLWGGRLSSRQPSPGLYAAFFLAAAVLCLPIIFLADRTMSGVFMIVEDPRYGSLLSAILLYFLPICVMGMVSPYSIRLLVSTEQHSGRMAGLLYFTSTIGSALGTLATSFYFVLWFTIDTIMWGIVILLLFCGGWILFLDRRLNIGEWNPRVAKPPHSE